MRVGWFRPLARRIGAGGRRFRLWLAAIEFSHNIGANRPRRNLCGRRLLALAVGPLVGRADEAAFDEDVRAFLDRRQNVFGKSWAEDADAMPFGLRRPFVFAVLPGALRGDGKYGEFGTVVPRLTLLR